MVKQLIFFVLLVCVIVNANAQQPDFSHMSMKQIMAYADSVKKATMKNLGNTLPNGDQLARFGDLSDPNALNNQDTAYTTVQFNCINTITSEHMGETVTFTGFSNHAPKYFLAGVTEVLADAQPASFTAMPTGDKNARLRYLSHLDNTLTGSGSYQYHNSYFDRIENKKIDYTGTGGGYESMKFDFKFDPGSNLFQCNFGGSIKIHYSPHNEDRETTGAGFGGAGAFNAINKGKPITVVGIEHFNLDPDAQSSVTVTSYGYKIVYDKVKRDGGRTETTHFTALIGAKPVQYDAIIEYVAMDETTPTQRQPKTYEKWMPYGPDKSAPNDKGNYIAFHVYLMDKITKKKIDEIPFKVQYKLISSQIPGICTNFPVKSDDTQNDLRFDADYYAQSTIAETVSDLEVVSKENLGKICYAKINCYDYGAYGKLTAHLNGTDEYGNEISLDAHFLDSTSTDIQVPQDYNNNHVADQWERDSSIFSKNYIQFADEEKTDGNTNDGDGYTLFEEYRGMMSKAKHVRLSPTKKELCIYNKSSFGKEDFDIFQNASGISIIWLDADEFDESTRIVNNQTNEGYRGAQHGLVIEDHDFGEDLGTLGKAMAEGGDRAPLTKPKDCKVVWVTSHFDNNNFIYIQHPIEYRRATFAHELAHACGVTHHNGDKNTIETIVSSFHLTDENTIVYDAATKQKITYASVVSRGEAGYLIVDMNEQKESESSGDINCFLAYNSTYPYSLYRSFFYSNISGKAVNLLIRKFPSDEIRTEFCSAKTGDSWNAANYLPVEWDCLDPLTGKTEHFAKTISVYGDALTGGNCKAQFQLKDWR